MQSAQRGFEVIAKLCKACPPGRSSEELAQKLVPYFESLVGWVDLFCVAGHIEISARLFYELWRLSPEITNRFRDPGSNFMKSLLSLWISKDSHTKSHVFSFTNLCPLINLFLGLTLDNRSKPLIVAALDAESSEGVTTVAQAFRLRMEEIVELHRVGTFTCEFAVKHLAKLADILDRLLPADSRGYRSRFLCEEHLLSTFYRSLALIMPTYQADATWSVAADTLKYLSRFIFEAGEYSGNPVAKLAEVISGSVTVLLLGCIFNLAPSDPKHQVAIDYINKIAPCFMYRQVWKAAIEYFPLERVELLPKHLFERLCAHSALAGSTWTALQVAFHTACEAHARSRKVLTRGCDSAKVCLPFITMTPPNSLVSFPQHYTHPNAPHVEQCSGCHSVVYCSRKCQEYDWEHQHRQECPLLSDRYRTRELNEWLPITTKADVLAYVEVYVNHQFRLFVAASMRLDRSVNQPFIGRLNITTLPYLVRVCPLEEYTLPDCKDPVFMDRAKSWVEEFGTKRGHQLVEVLFTYGKKGHFAMVHLHSHGNDRSKKVVHGVFAFDACKE